MTKITDSTNSSRYPKAERGATDAMGNGALIRVRVCAAARERSSGVGMIGVPDVGTARRPEAQGAEASDIRSKGAGSASLPYAAPKGGDLPGAFDRLPVFPLCVDVSSVMMAELTGKGFRHVVGSALPSRHQKRGV